MILLKNDPDRSRSFHTAPFGIRKSLSRADDFCPLESAATNERAERFSAESSIAAVGIPVIHDRISGGFCLPVTVTYGKIQNPLGRAASCYRVSTRPHLYAARTSQ
jgi:hypothetical protein